MGEELQKPNYEKPVFKMFPQAVEMIEQDICPVCGKPIGEFRDELSKKEYSISGMCQTCQDIIFK